MKKFTGKCRSLERLSSPRSPMTQATRVGWTSAAGSLTLHFPPLQMIFRWVFAPIVGLQVFHIQECAWASVAPPFTMNGATRPSHACGMFTRFTGPYARIFSASLTQNSSLQRGTNRSETAQSLSSAESGSQTVL